MSQDDKVAQFQSVSGLSEGEARKRLAAAHWNADAALSTYFDQNKSPPKVFHQPKVDPWAGSTVQKKELPQLYGQRCGLFDTQTNQPLPLIHRDLHSQISPYGAMISLRDRYRNEGSEAVEVELRFDLEGSAVDGVEVSLDGVPLQGEVREKQSAAEDYDDALAEGRRAALGGIREDETFQLNVGKVDPGDIVDITLRYVSAVRQTIDRKDGVTMGLVTLPLPPKRAVGDIRLDVTWTCEIQSVRSNTSEYLLVPLPPISENKKSTTPSFTFVPEGDVEGGGGDQIVVEVVVEVLEDPNGVTVSSPQEDGSRVLAARFAPPTSSSAPVQGEFVFVLDRSGSMGGSRMRRARRALQLFLRSLPLGCRFNIVGFGSRFEAMRPTSQVYDDASLTSASEYVSALHADLGGTNLLLPLRHVLTQPVDSCHPRSVFILTDGEVLNTSELLQYVKSSVGNTRIYTLGVGTEASRRLVRQLAVIGGGEASFVDRDEGVEETVVGQLQRAVSPVWENPYVVWPEGCQDPAPQGWRAIRDGEVFTAFTLVPSGVELTLPISATLRGTGDVEVVVSGECTDIIEGLARQCGRVWLDVMDRKHAALLPDDPAKGPLRAAAVEMGVRLGMTSSFTSYVLTGLQDEETSKEPVKYTGTLLQERAPALSTVETDILELQAMFQDLSTMVRDQGESLQRIDCAFDSGSSELLSAQMFRRTSAPSKVWSSVGRAWSAVTSWASSATLASGSVETSYSRLVPQESPSVPLPGPVIGVEGGGGGGDPLDVLMAHQGASGMFRFSHEVLHVLGIEGESVRKLEEAEGAEGVWITVLCVVYLEEVLGDRRREWVMLAEKADQWLQTTDVYQAMGRETLWRDAKALLPLSTSG